MTTEEILAAIRERGDVYYVLGDTITLDGSFAADELRALLEYFEKAREVEKP